MAKELHSFDGNEVIATELPQYLNQNFTAIPSNMGVWEKNEAVEVGDIRLLSGRENAGYVLECVASGTTGETQPLIVEESTEMLANYSDNGIVGRMRIIFNPAEKDIDEVFATGVVYSRLTYPELWEYVQLRAGLLIDEETWQAKFAETNGKFVPYYSSGDGSTTFRTPILGGYLKGAEVVGEIGEYLQAGLPSLPDMSHTHTRGTMNINGTISQFNGGSSSSGNGAFTLTDTTVAAASSGTGNRYYSASFDASQSWTGETSEFISPNYNPLYGSASTVQPETMTGIWVVKAIGVVVDSSGTTDVAQLLTATEQVQERVNEVENFASTVGIPVGFMYLSMEKTVPYGRLPALGSTYSRSLYADLWAYANERGLVKTESEWQAIASANNGNCAYYSSGDGSTTFRVPSIKCWVKGAGSTEEVGSYLQAGLPQVKLTNETAITLQGVSVKEPKTVLLQALGGGYGAYSTTASLGNTNAVGMNMREHAYGVNGSDLVAQNSIYGNADTVQPPSIVGQWLIVAFGVAHNIGEADVANVMQAVEQVQTSVGTLEQGVGTLEQGVGTAIDYIVESYRNGTEWYEVYKSGKVRQGGKTANGTGTNVTLLKPYANTNYLLTVGGGNNNGNWPYGNVASATQVFVGVRGTSGGSSLGCYWVAEGQGA